jgi:hypothetical protein
MDLIVMSLVCRRKILYVRKNKRLNNKYLRKHISCTEIGRHLKFGQLANQMKVDCLDWNSKTRRVEHVLTLSDPTSDLVRQYDFPVLFRRRKTSETVFVAFVRPLSEPIRPFSSCSTDFSQQLAQVVLFLYLHVFLF